jgi:hypothetical protein
VGRGLWIRHDGIFASAAVIAHDGALALSGAGTPSSGGPGDALRGLPTSALIHYVETFDLPAFVEEAIAKELAFRCEEILAWACRRRAG